MRVRSGLVCAIVLGASFSLSSSIAHAQLPSIDVRTWKPSVDPSASMVLESPNTPGPWQFNFGSYLDWQFRPVTVKDTSGNTLYRPIDAGFNLNVLANIGLGDHASFGVVVPAVIYQTGSENLPTNVAAVPVSHTALGDIGLSAKVKILGNPNGGFGVAGIVDMSIPTGDHSSFAGEGAVTTDLRLLVDYSFVVAHVQASLGYLIRTEYRTWPDASVGGYNFGNEIPWSFGIRVRPDIFHIDKEDRQTWEIAAHGWLPGGPQAPFVDRGASALSPVMLAFSDRIALGRDKDTFVTAGIDIGLSDAVGVPGFRLVAGIGWAPREHDKDHDGVPDNVDQCEDIPEDRDGFEDSDGCPDIDNDNDGIIDREDACPNVSGPKSDDPKLNGCPHEVKTVEPIKTPETPLVDPTKDDDGDGIPNGQDACPNVAGEPSTDPKFNGCPNPDRDGDTFLNDQDECPDAAEVFNGIKDEDGCPDEGGKALVAIDTHLVVKLANAIKVSGDDAAPVVDPASMPTLRALALELNKHRDWTLAVAAKPAGVEAPQHAAALFRALAIVNALTKLTRRDGAAETVGWDAVKTQPTAASGIGLLMFAAPPPPPPPAAGKK